MAVFIGDTLYFDAIDDTTGLSQLWAHDTSNRTTWKVYDGSAQGGSMNAHSARLLMVLGDTLYFRANLDTAYGYEMWAHDTSNQSTWFSDQIPGIGGSTPGYGGTVFFHNGTMYFDIMTVNSGPQAVGPQSVVNQLPNQHGWSCDLLGHQWHVAEWCVLQQPYRSTLWNADRIVATDQVPGLGQQQWWFECGLS